MTGSAHSRRLGKRMRTNAASSSRRTSERPRGREEPAQQLLPGIPDDVSMNCVSPHLSWRALYALSCVSQKWKREIRSGRVYDARVRAEGTETLAVIEHIQTGATAWATTRALGLYSGKDELVFKLPPIPNVPAGIPRGSKSISLDGKVYVVGEGEEDDYPPLHEDWSHMPRVMALDVVYVLDLARQRPWERCQNMVHPRVHPGLGVVGGKINVLGGANYWFGQAVTNVGGV